MQRPEGHERGQNIYPRVAWLLLHCKNQEPANENGWMAETTTKDVYLETVEETQSKSSEPNQTRNQQGQGLSMGKYEKGILAHIKESGIALFHHKQKAHTGRILRFPATV